MVETLGHSDHLSVKVVLHLLEVGHHTGKSLVVVLIKDAHKTAQLLLQEGEREEVAHAVKEVAALHLFHLLGGGVLLLDALREVEHRGILNDIVGREGCRKHHPFEGFAAREGHIGLPVGKGAADIDDGMLKSQALTLVDGDAPSRAQRILRKGTFHHLLDFFRLLVESIACVLPLFALHLDAVSAVLALHHDALVRHRHHLTEHSVEIAVFARTVVFDKHHLCPDFEDKCFGRGVGRRGEVALDDGFEGKLRRGEGSEPFLVDAVGLMVVRHQPHIGFVGRWDEIGEVAAVECGERCTVEGVGAHRVEKCQEAFIALTIDRFEFYGHKFCLLQGAAGKEIERVVVAREQSLLLLFGHGRKLLEVANHEQLHTAEGTMAVAIAAQHSVHVVEQVGAHHRDFVDDEEVERADEPLFALTHAKLLPAVIGPGDVGGKWDLQKRMYRHPSCIDGRNARGGQHHQALRAFGHQTPQEGGLPRTRLSGEEDVGVGIFDDLASQSNFRVGHVGHDREDEKTVKKNGCRRRCEQNRTKLSIYSRMSRVRPSFLLPSFSREVSVLSKSKCNKSMGGVAIIFCRICDQNSCKPDAKVVLLQPKF